MSHEVGVVGLGLMGSALADVLLAGNIDLAVWNRSADKCKRFAQQGVGVADSVETLVAGCDAIIVCLTDHATSMEVLEPQAVAESMSGKTLILLSTMNTEESVVTAEWATEHGIAYLDGAILGYPANVRDMSCMIVYSGPKSLFDANLGILNTMGGMPRLVGEQAGSALLFDKAIYSAYYAHIVGLLHGAAICDATGAPMDVYIEAMTEYWEWAEEDAVLLQRVKNRDYSLAEASLDIHAQGFDLIGPWCDRVGVDSKLPNLIAEFLNSGLAQGHGNNELAALFEVLKQPTGASQNDYKKD